MRSEVGIEVERDGVSFHASLHIYLSCDDHPHHRTIIHGLSMREHLASDGSALERHEATPDFSC